jgi:type VI secretion system secreted protein VgrG
VGRHGEEIWTDKYGRIKVKFHWDRDRERNENSSCWIRVASPWAGKNWGAIAVPRVGQEVVVQFLEGDPDRPIVIGSVYNADQMPPWDLPANQTQSGVKTRSSKGGSGSNYNELRFEDKKGSEDVYFHAEKNFHRVVEHDDDLKVGNNQSIEVQENRTKTVVKGNETVTIKQGNRQVELGMGSDALIIKMGNLSTTLKMGNQSTKLDLGGSTTEAMQSIELKVGQSSVKIDQMGVTIKGMMINIEGQISTQLKGMMTTINGSAMLTAGGGITMIG